MKAMIWLAIIFYAAGTIAFLAMRGNSQPKTIAFGSDLTYTAKKVQAMMADPDVEVRRIIAPGLFPYDLVFLICLGACLALASLLIAPHTAVFTGSTCLLLIFPFLYVVSDFTENSLLAWMLSHDPPTITDRFVVMVKVATWLKLGFVTLSIVQVLYLLGAWGYRFFKPATEAIT